MKAAIIRQHGLPESIHFAEKKQPEPGASEYLIQVKACGLNHLDVWVRRGVPGHQFPLPLIPGSDITGVIEKVGVNATKFKVGDRVIVDPQLSCGECDYCNAGKENLCVQWGLLGETIDGGCQEYIAVKERQVFPLPDNLSFEKGACIPINFVTAWHMVNAKAGAEKGQTILVHAAGSGVSVAVIQIAKILGLTVFVTSRSRDKLERAKTLGADRFIDTSKESFFNSVKNLTGKRGVDIVIDHVVGEHFFDSIRCLKKGGKLVSCGATAGSQITLDWKYIFFKNISLIGSTYGTRKDFIDVLRHFESGKLKANIDSSVELKDLPHAHQAIEDHKVFGKIVVKF